MATDPPKPAAKPPEATEPPKAEAVPKPAAKPKIKVQALAKGYYGGELRERGDIFAIDSATEFGGWMAPVGQADADALRAQVEKAKDRKTIPPPIDSTVAQTPAMRTVKRER